MKRGAVFLIFLLILLLLISVYLKQLDTINLKDKNSVTGSTITGNATSSSVALTITISGSPTLNIIKPENETYFTTTNLELNFTASNADTIKYNLDNGTNTTITGNTTFNTTSGLHTLYLFANNSDGLSTKNVTFTVNATKFIVYYNNYSGSTRGESTDFNKSSFEDIQNLSGIVLENTSTGKILFNTAINLTDDSTYTDNELNLDINTNISSNFISINTTALGNFNKSATLSLYNLTFTNPRVLRDGSACPAAICTEVSYSSGTFVFNVTYFSNYSAGETPSEAGETPSGGGGGGARIAFVIDKNQISVSMNPGQVKEERITITNTGSDIINIKIDNLFTDFIAKGEDTITLNPGESKKIPFYIVARVDTVPDLYLGKITISSGSVKKEVLIAVEVESKGILLDVRAEILDGYKKVLPGENILAEMRLFNLGGPEGRKDVLIEYMIRDYDNNTITIETESLAIQTQASFVKAIDIPEKTKTGNYVLYVRAIYNGYVASSSDNFEVVSSKATQREKVYIVIIIILSIILALTIYLIIVHREKMHGKIFGKGAEKITLKRLMR